MENRAPFREKSDAIGIARLSKIKEAHLSSMHSWSFVHKCYSWIVPIQKRFLSDNMTLTSAFLTQLQLLPFKWGVFPLGIKPAECAEGLQELLAWKSAPVHPLDTHLKRWHPKNNNKSKQIKVGKRVWSHQSGCPSPPLEFYDLDPHKWVSLWILPWIPDASNLDLGSIESRAVMTSTCHMEGSSTAPWSFATSSKSNIDSH